MSAEQELYDWVFGKCLEITDEVFDYLPPEDEDVVYPFIYVGNISKVASGTMTSSGGMFTVDVDVWGSRKQRREVSELTDRVMQILNTDKKTEHYTFHAYAGEQKASLMLDTSVPNTVFHRGAITFTFRLY